MIYTVLGFKNDLYILLNLIIEDLCGRVQEDNIWAYLVKQNNKSWILPKITVCHFELVNNEFGMFFTFQACGQFDKSNISTEQFMSN